VAEEGAWTRIEGGALTTRDLRPFHESARRFAEVVKLNGLDSRIINRVDERRLLEEGIGRYGLTLDEARGTLRTVAEDEGYVFETQTGKRIQQLLARHAGKHGRISKQEFRRAAELLQDFSDGAVNASESRRQVKRMMIDNGWRPSRAGLFRTKGWFKQINT
jgi:hypothetical protein